MPDVKATAYVAIVDTNSFLAEMANVKHGAPEVGVP